MTQLDATRSESEKRPLATWPSLGGDSRLWRIAVEAYCNDRFGGRAALVHAHSQLHLDLLGQSPLDRVVLGRDGWLYYGDEYAGGVKGLRPMTPERLAAWVEALDARRHFAEAQGANYALLVGPDKHTIYPEHLPPGFAPRPPTPFDQLLEHLARERPDLVVLDVRQALRRAKGQGPLYWPLDSHWTSGGAFVAAQAVVDAARRWHPELAPLERAEVEQVTWPQTSNDVACLLAVPERFGHAPLPGLVPRPRPRALLPLEVWSDSFGEALLPFLGLRFACHPPLPLEQALRADQPPPALMLDVLVERKLALDAPPLPTYPTGTLIRVAPALRFKSSRGRRLALSGADLARVQAAPAKAADLEDGALELSGANSVTLRLGAAEETVGPGWAQVEIEVRERVHRVEVRQANGTRADVLPPGAHVLTFRVEEALELRVTAAGGSPLTARITRLELRGP